jgi:hypothetical protein
MQINKSLVVLSAMLILGLPMAAAQSQDKASEVGPGLVGADSMFYGLEVAWDNAAVRIGFKNAGKVTQERAAEAEDAMEGNKTEAAVKAAQNAQKMAERVKSEQEEERVQKAMNSLQETMNKMSQRIQNAPNENARQGMQNALQNMQAAVNNMEDDGEAREKAGRQGRKERNGQDSENRTEGQYNVTNGASSGEQDMERSQNRSAP